MEQKKLLYVEDETTIRNNFSEFFLTNGYNVFAVDGEEKAQQLISLHADFDCAVFDVELGKNPFAGIELCRIFREKFPLVPVLILSAYTDTDLQEMSYKLGADAFIDKREPLTLLAARLETLVARYNLLLNGGVKPNYFNQHVLASEGLFVDSRLGRAAWLGTELSLNQIRLAVLEELYKARGKTISVYDIQQSLNIVVESNTIVQHIKIIREAFVKVDPEFNCIRTVRGKGYRWVGVKI
jgi:two-component system, OmpR family, response regulator